MNAPVTAPAISTSEIATALIRGTVPAAWAGCEAPAAALGAVAEAPGATPTVDLAAAARAVMHREVGPAVHPRGLIEFSNICDRGCFYCGIRRGSPGTRYTLSEEQIIRAARRSFQAGYGSMTLQAGERRDREFLDFLVAVLRRIKRETRSPELPEGLGITLSVGEQSREEYERLYEAGAHRYLLRIETSDPELFARLHPPGQRFDRRLRALGDLKEIGYQVGTGVMIGVPGQDEGSLARDVEFFREIDADMIGMGPYLEPREPVAALMKERGLAPAPPPDERLRLSLRMIAITRIVLRDVNIAATTALEVLAPGSRESALAHGANVLMPILTPRRRRGGYELYRGKAGVTDAVPVAAAGGAVRVAGRPVTRNGWGDAPHATRDKESSG